MENEPRKSITFRVTEKIAEIYRHCAESEGYNNLTAWMIMALNERVKEQSWRDHEKLHESEAP